MKTLERRQRIRRIMYSIPSLIILLIVAVFLIKGAARILNKEIKSKKDSQNLEKKVNMLITRESELKDKILRLKTEEGIKDEMREKFNVAQEGEFIAVIVDERRTSTSTDDLILPWYKRFWNVIVSFYD